MVHLPGLPLGREAGAKSPMLQRSPTRRGDLVHAGAGYAEEHVRVHAYVDTPEHIYRRPRERTNLCGGAGSP